MNIFVSNDDGVYAEGIQVLISELLDQGHHVFVCAPSDDRSCSGHGLSLGKEVEILKIKENVFSCTGLPADCAHLGVRSIFSDIKFDLAISGINHGGNLGQDIYYSGTVAAAREASFLNIPSISLSVCLKDQESSKIHFNTIFKFLDKYLIDQFVEGFERGDVLNINFPNLPPGQVNGIKHTKPGFRNYTNDILQNESRFIIKGKYDGVTPNFEDIDSVVVEKGQVSVTKIKVF